jgi:tetratricopeptide (TPR) repeat protein/predicted Ser/Thr protein kinase/TolB-like protein
MKCPKCGADNAPASSSCGGCGASLSPGETVAAPRAPADLVAGSIFAGRYRINHELGKGGMGVVYKAEDVKLKRPVAIKFLPWWLTCEDAAKERFIHEAQAASALDHTNICTIYEVDETPDGRMFMAMAFCEGEPLKKMIERALLEVDQALDIAIQACDGLAAAHDAGMTHRDIKPANIMVSAHGHVKIVDFGLAKLAGQTRLTRAGTVVGTVAYMAPEQARGQEVDGRADIWSLGAVLYEMLTGGPPFKGSNDQAVIHAILNEEPERPSKHNGKVHGALEAAVLKCLRRDPQDRFATADDLQIELLRIRGDRPSRLASASGRILERKPASTYALSLSRPGPRVALGAAVVLCLLALTSVLPPGRPLLKSGIFAGWLGLGGLPAAKYAAILPLDVAGDDPDSRAFCDGLIDAQTRKLNSLGSLAESVSVATWVELRRAEVTTPAEARHELGTNLAIAGRTEMSGEAITVKLSLVDTKTMRRLKHFEASEPLANLAVWQDSIVTAMGRMLELGGRARERLLVKPGCTFVPAAYGAYIEGRGYLYPRSGEAAVDKAVERFSSAIAEDSSFAQAYVGLGEAYSAKYDATKDTAWGEKAARWCARAGRLCPELPSAPAGEGSARVSMGRYAQALAPLGAAVGLDSNYVEAYYWMGRCHQRLGNYDLAEACFKKAIALRPKWYEGYSWLGDLCLERGDYQSAIKPFEVMIRLRPERTAPYNNLGVAYMKLERWEDARSAFERALEIAPRASTYSNLGTIEFYQARYADAAKMYKKALDMEGNNYRVWGNYAESCYWTPDEREKAGAIFSVAVSLAEKELSGNPDDAAVLADLASYNSMMGNREQALAYLGRALSRGIAGTDLIFRAAETYEQLGRRDLALEWVGKAMASGCSPALVDRYPGLKDLRSDPRFDRLRQRS